MNRPRITKRGGGGESNIYIYIYIYVLRTGRRFRPLGGYTSYAYRGSVVGMETPTTLLSLSHHSPDIDERPPWSGDRRYNRERWSELSFDLMPEFLVPFGAKPTYYLKTNVGEEGGEQARTTEQKMRRIRRNEEKKGLNRNFCCLASESHMVRKWRTKKLNQHITT
jgi:hypothetical protein